MRNYPCHGVISVLPTQGACSSIKLISLLLVGAIAADDQQIIYGAKRLSICRISALMRWPQRRRRSSCAALTGSALRLATRETLR
jgi:hypothetical protein